jgi:hypothetical protein
MESELVLAKSRHSAEVSRNMENATGNLTRVVAADHLEWKDRSVSENCSTVPILIMGPTILF